MTFKRSLFVRGLLFALLIAMVFANCGFAAGQSEWVIYSFVATSNGRVPNGNLVADAAGNLYGTTRRGGTFDEGTVYELVRPVFPETAWTETILLSFGGNGEYYPFSGLTLDAAGNLYGTASEGGSWPFGTVFELTPPVAGGALWTETILYSFGSTDYPYDGDSPRTAPAFDHTGNLYGTTSGGTGKACIGEGALCSTVYELTPPATAGGGWTETVLHTFGPPVADKAVGATMLDGKGNVYGATELGVIYRLTPPATTGGAWRYRVLYDFDSAATGESPEGSLTLHKNGHLYGTTLAGSANFGTIFELAPPAVPGGAWTENPLYTFTGGSDGSNPVGNVTSDPDGNLYGATSLGGANGSGVVFKLTPPASEGAGWSELVLHNFAGGTDGSQPLGGLIFGPHGVLYGTTAKGGAANRGIVFAVEKK